MSVLNEIGRNKSLLSIIWKITEFKDFLIRKHSSLTSPHQIVQVKHVILEAGYHMTIRDEYLLKVKRKREKEKKRALCCHFV